MESEDNSKVADHADGLKEYAALGNKQKVLAFFYEQDRTTSCTAAKIAESTSIELKLIWNDTADLIKSQLLEEAGKEGRFKLYRLSTRGRRVIDSWLESWKDRQSLPEPEAPFDLSRQIDIAKRLIMHEMTQRNMHAVPKIVRIPLDALLEFPDFADLVLDNPDEGKQVLKIAFSKLDLPAVTEDDGTHLDVIFLNLPESQNLQLSQIGHEHLDHLYAFDAILSKMSELHTRVTMIKYECPSCGNVLSVSQPAMGSRVSPTKCGCGRKGKFKVLDRERVNTRFISLEEPVESVDTQMSPVKKSAVLNNSLATPFVVKTFPPGSRVKVIGIPREIEQTRKEGGTDVVSKFYLEVVNVIPLQDDTFDTLLSDEDRARCHEIARDINENGLAKLVESYSPYVSGHRHIKEALLLTASSGKNTPRPGELKIARKNIHVLLVGDTGVAKTTLAKSLLQIVPRMRFAMAAGQSSGAGLIAAVEKDTTFNMGWTLEAGHLVLAHNSICIVDEIDKMKEEQYSLFLEVMEDQSVTISKATIKQTMAAWTGVLGLANPKGGRFDDHEPLAKQIGMPAYLLNRFDLIITLLDIPNSTSDAATVQTMMKMQLDISSGQRCNTPYSQEELRKYVTFLRQQPNPSFTPEAAETLTKFYLPIRSQYKQTHQVPINARVMESITRLSIAYARIRLSNKVEAIDGQRACQLYGEIMRNVLTDVETGNISIDQIENPVTKLERVKAIIEDLEKSVGKVIPVDAVLREAGRKGISSDIAEDIIDKLKRNGDIYTPKPGFMARR